MLDNLRKISFYIKIDPVDTIGHAAYLDTVSRVLSAINRSYMNYFSIEYSKNKCFSADNTIIEAFLRQIRLLVVDLNFDSMQSALAPGLMNLEDEMFADQNGSLDQWKMTKYNDFKYVILSGDYSQPNYIKMIGDRYTPKERSEIFHPLFIACGDSNEYYLKFKREPSEDFKRLIVPDNKIKLFYEKDLNKKKKDNTYNFGVFEVKYKSDSASDKNRILKNGKILKQRDIGMDSIRVERVEYILNSVLYSKINYKDNSIFLNNNEFDIIVWGDSIEKAREALCFAFHSLYVNYALEEDINLTPKAIELKQKLLNLVKNVKTIE